MTTAVVEVLREPVPSRSWFDARLGATMSTGEDARAAVHEFCQLPTELELPVAADIETPGLVRFDIHCLTAAWRWPDDHPRGGRIQAVLLDPQRSSTDYLAADDLCGHAGSLIFHNAPFDVPRLWHLGIFGKGTINRIIDTLVLARIVHADVRVPKRLEDMAKRYLDLVETAGGMEFAFKCAGFKNKDLGYEGMDIWSPIYRYGAMADTIATLGIEPLLRESCIDWLIDHPFVEMGATTRAAAESIIETQEIVNRVMLRRSAVGLAVDRDELDAYTERTEAAYNQATAALAVHGLEAGKGKGPALVRYIHAMGELPDNWPHTPGGDLRATKDDLEYLSELHPIAAQQVAASDIDQVLGYLRKVDYQASTTGRCHPQVKTLGASATGRMSVSEPPYQQFSKNARPIITDDGQGITSIDWSQIEPVVMGLMARDPEFLSPYEAGADLYGPIMLSCGVDRDTAKVALLQTMYGSGIASLARKIRHTEESTGQIRRQMFAAMPESEKWMSYIQYDVAKRFGVVITAAGRILPVHEQAIFKAVNYVVQGSAYDVLAHSIVEMERRGIGDHVQLALHDELVVDTAVADEVREIMATPPPFLYHWAQRDDILLRVDVHDLGHAWAKV